MRLKGVCYDVGTVYYFNWRPNFDPKVVHRELEIIKQDLHCNAIRISGFSIDRLMITAEIALKQGLEVWLSPQLWDKSQQQTVKYLTKVALSAEKLHKQQPENVVFSVGSESTLFTQGILEGKNIQHRMTNQKNWTKIKAKEHNKPLNEFLKRANDSVRQVFHGKVTYASLIWETVDWSLFDFVGVDHYRMQKIKDQYIDMLNPLFELRKPVVITEFGYRTYQGASSSSEGMAGDIVDHKTELMHHIPLIGRFIRPKIRGEHIRDESSQANEIIDQLRVLDKSGVDGTFISTFVSPLNYNNDNPRFDIDMSSYSLVKSYAGNKHGITYPDMTWEPKESFNAVADYYAKH
ncbi:MAG TPA: abortive infection protein [Candidatus Nanoarchaeia archaeon]|nr:abortive infection protein [Candidatus Nanoarchaeia archaeon]